MTAENSETSEPSRGVLLATGGVFMFTLTLAIGLTILAFGLINRSAGVVSAEPAVPLGQQVFEARCAVCHGATGDGGVGPQLSDGKVVEAYPDPSDHKAVVVNGKGAMPSFALVLSREEIEAVVEFERSGL